ncbi:hypothetical protein N781_10925 [Pontibacillus halophilus JSM 076056 = DSM 19796]|uniref:DUF4352 domain-containing protein n=1 Tax=Pontibacillus halophilus JSM 076056 = DSM 19796 TaxID=1385510 RepID=A0A0A5GR47_9BACI|nr:hypothetical protein [Pontibacillus halophilus]KGX93635.1 hypothetical protein N781_10925 [Pontibacillus halophilus JSM 076056 = DSM 19796]
MFKYWKSIGISLLLATILVGCGDAENSSANSDKDEEPKQSDQESLNQKEEPSEPKTNEDGNIELLEVGQTAESQAGKAELLKIKKVNETVDVAPINVTIQDIKVIKLTEVDPAFAEELSYMADANISNLDEGFSYIQVQYTAENTTEENIEWYDLMNVVTDQGEQIDGQMKDFLVTDSDMESMFIGEVKKEFQDAFVVKNADINEVKLVFGYTMNGDSYETITEKQTVEYTLE